MSASALQILGIGLIIALFAAFVKGIRWAVIAFVMGVVVAWSALGGAFNVVESVAQFLVGRA